MIVCYFYIPHSFPNLNDVVNMTKRHWSYYASAKAEYTNIAKIYASKARKQFIQKKDVCYKVQYTWNVKNRGADGDNIDFARKYINDGIVSAGLLQKDSLTTIIEFGCKFNYTKKEGVLVEIIELDYKLV